ncbi:MAG: hypothetical protein PHD76_12735 [Methylacidiphilales bacterium]|nr:hypothetical protein [Candidatus Methylacidiphilales bacterium]
MITIAFSFAKAPTILGGAILRRIKDLQFPDTAKFMRLWFVKSAKIWISQNHKKLNKVVQATPHSAVFCGKARMGRASKAVTPHAESIEAVRAA